VTIRKNFVKLFTAGGIRCIYMGAIMWGTRETRPPTFSDSEDIICHAPHIFLFRFRNILVSHQAVPLTFYNKIALMCI